MSFASIAVPFENDNRRGIAYVLVGMAAFAVGDAFVKLLGAELPLGQLIAVRGALASMLLVALVIRLEGGLDLRAARRPRMIVRTAFEIGATVCFLSALVRIPIASATAILQVIPLAVTFFGSIFLGERVGWRRYCAIMAGFAGILVIVRPTSEGLDAGALFALGTVACSTGRDLVTRGFPREISSLQVVTTTTIAVTVAGIAWMSVEGSAPMTASHLGAVAASAVLLPIGLFCVAAAVRTGELAVVTPFRYSIFLWALLIGYLAFGEVPDAATLVGAAIVLASGLYTLFREASLDRDIAARSGKRGVPA